MQFDPIYINEASSMFVDDHLLDFYMVAYDNITSEIS